MSISYGVNLTEGQMKGVLEKIHRDQAGVSTWQKLLGNAGLGHAANVGAIKTDFADTVSQAYASSFAQKNAIKKAGLNAYATENLLRNNNVNLRQAYESALSNYNTNLEKANEAYNEELKEIDTDLTTEANNYIELLNKSYDYLKELSMSNQSIPGTAENGAEAIYEGSGKNTEFKGYQNVDVNFLQDNNLAWTLDDSGALKSWEDIQAEMFDDNYRLNARGVEFFDAVYNANSQDYIINDPETGEQRTLRSFLQYLSDTSPELRDWYVGTDNYNTGAKHATKAGTLNVLTGRESDDFLYNKNDYYVYDANKFSELLKSNTLSINATTNALDTLKSAEAELSTAESQYKTAMAQKAPKGSTANRSALTEASQRRNAAAIEVERARNKANEAWTSYKSALSTTKENLSNYLVEKLGKDRSNTFWNENVDLLNEYNDLVEQLTDKSTYDEVLSDRATVWYEKFTSKLEQYLKDNTYRTGKNSGR